MSHSLAIVLMVRCPDGWPETREEGLRPLSEVTNPVKEPGRFATLGSQRLLHAATPTREGIIEPKAVPSRQETSS